MEVKKKNIFTNLRLKIGNKKKPAKNPFAKKKRNMPNRRSVSVPDLSEALSAEESSPGVDDTDSAVQYCPEDKPGDSVPKDQSSVASNRMSAPMETMSLIEEITDEMASNADTLTNMPQDLLSAQTKNAKGNAASSTVDPAPATRHVLVDRQVLSPSPDLADRESLSGRKENSENTQRVLSGTLASALVRAHSLGEQQNLYKEKKDMAPERATPPRMKKIAFVEKPQLVLDIQGPPENADLTSLDSACDTPSEDQVSTLWTDSEEPEPDPDSCLETRDTQLDEDQDDLTEIPNEQSDDSDENGQDPAMTGGTEDQVSAPFQRYLLNINLKRGKNLVIRDKRAGSSDPYVKFKMEGKQLYKSKVVYKNLNPRWNESFSYPLRDRDHVMEVRVFDKNRTTDDFMGASAISLKEMELYKTYELELPLEDPKSKEDDMGVVFVDVYLTYRDPTLKRTPIWIAKIKKPTPVVQRTGEVPAKNQQSNQTWSRVLTVALIEGQDFPSSGQGDIYVRFRLGEQKYKSKHLCVQPNPQWREQFDFNQFEDNQEPLQVEVYSKRGRKGEESWGMFEIDLESLTLNERQFYTHVLNPGKGILVLLVTLRSCWGVSISEVETALMEKPDERKSIQERFSLRNSHKCMGEVGFLQVKVIKANDLPTTDLNGKSNAFCVIELGNGKLQSHTVYKTVNPDWNKAFTFPIKDINDVIELTVFEENGVGSPTFLGKVDIPLLTIQNGQEITLFLKKENLESLSKGTITVAMEVVYNQVRACVRTFQPKEAKLNEENLKFSKKALARHIFRVRKISTVVLNTLQYIKSCFQWESTQRSLLAFLIFLVTVWHWDLFMLPLFLLLLIGWNYFQLAAGKATFNQDLANESMGEDEDEDEKEAGKKGLMDKIHMVQEIVLTVQSLLDEIANIGERVKNIFNWSVPFLSTLACVGLFAATALLYFVPLRYIVLIWGVHKFTKKLRNPYSIDNNEILDFLRRVPSDVQKVQYSMVRAPTSQKKKK
ncbi:multiple C2 and transmembrane domain-containing protein 2 isoform X2 [Betta splendens]|nr:multiple C2 and transmembrane domain-containing protein 2 isoform X2 [Betta splendens]XP_029008654.1 multiple C2 and transmembrane domain-containing protein 2 isoform X2 [Betta splendens]